MMALHGLIYDRSKDITDQEYDKMQSLKYGWVSDNGLYKVTEEQIMNIKRQFMFLHNNRKKYLNELDREKTSPKNIE